MSAPFAISDARELMDLTRSMEIIYDPARSNPPSLSWIELCKRRKNALEDIRRTLRKYGTLGRCCFHKTDNVTIVRLSLITPHLQPCWPESSPFMPWFLNTMCWSCMLSVISTEDHVQNLQRLQAASDSSTLPDPNQSFDDADYYLDVNGLVTIEPYPDNPQRDSPDGSGSLTRGGVSTPTFISDVVMVSLEDEIQSISP